MLHRSAPLYLSLVTAIAGCAGGSSDRAFASSASYGSSGGAGGSAASAPMSGSYGGESSGGAMADSVASTPTSRPAMDMPSPVRASAPVAPGTMAVRRAEASPVAVGATAGGSAGMVAPTSVTVTTTTSVTTNVAPVIVEQQQTTAGLLTAATVGDHDRRNPYLEYLGRHSGERSMLRLDMSRRVRFRVLDGQGQPVNDATISVVGSGAQVAGRSHADGIWDFYPNLYGAQVGGTMSVHVRSSAGEAQASVNVPFGGDGQDVMVRLNGSSAGAPRVLDLGFAIDVTGSMGDELHYIHAELSNIVQRIQASVPGTTVRVGATFYRDRTDPVVVQQIPFTTNIPGFVSMMGTVSASGGGDYPEDMNAGLEAAMRRLQWSEGNAVRVLVVVADAPPQHYNDTQFTYREAMFDAASRGIRLLPVAASGADRSVEYLFRAMGASSGAPYVYLTDESGVGNPHMEADTDRVAVERFNGLLTRLVISDLRGQGMHEMIRDAQ